MDRALALRCADAQCRKRVLVAALHVYWRADALSERSVWVEELSALPLTDAADRLEVARWSMNIALERCDGGAAARALEAYGQAARELREPQALMNHLLRRAILALSLIHI